MQGSADANRPGKPDEKGRTRRAFLASVGIGALASACAGGLDGLVDPQSQPEQPQQQGGDVIGTGPVKVALILPLSSPNAQAPATSLRNAAQLAMSDFGGSNIQILIKDDKGTPDGARQATQEALQAGAELVLGPLLGPNVQAAGQVARAAGKPVIAFSSDATAAQRGVYLLSFLPQTDVQRVVSFAGSRGKKSFAALIPQSAYGNVVEAEFQQAGNQGGRRVATVARYQPGNKASLDAAINQLKGAIGSADTLFIPENADSVGAVAQALSAAGITSRSIQIISTGVWNDPRVFALGALDGAWFAAPDNAGFNALAGRYQSQFGAPPTRIATLAYDAVTLVSALTQNFGTQRFSEATLTNPNGFSGQDGVFRFRSNGTNERGLAVYEIRSGSAQVVSARPTSFTGG